MNKKIPLSIALETAKNKLVASVNEILAETNLPAYLLEGVVMEILADVRNRKAHELLSDLNSMKSGADEKSEG